MDALLDLWINTVYNDTQVQGSDVVPVVYLRNGTENPLLGYADLVKRCGVFKATASRYVCKLILLDYISAVTFGGTHGTALYLKNYLSTMFQISDVLVDKDEVAMSLNLTISTEEYTDGVLSSSSFSNTGIIVQKVGQILSAQGFPFIFCHKSSYKL